MEIDRNKIEKISQMPDKEFAKIIYTVVLQAGGDEAQAKMAMSLAPMIKQKLRTTADTELSKILKTIGEEKVRGILDSLDA